MLKGALATSTRTARRVAVGAIGGTVLAVGVALLVLPGPAFVVIPIGLGILAAEFAWARRWLRKLKSGADGVLKAAKRGAPGVALLALASAPALLGGCARSAVEIALPETLGGRVRVDVVLPAGARTGGMRVTLDGRDVTGQFTPGGPGLVAFLDDPGPGPHAISVHRPLLGGLMRTTHRERFESPGRAPALVSTRPAAGATKVARSIWPELEFAEAPDPAAAAGWGFAIACGGERVPADAHWLGRRLVLNPRPALPSDASCRIVWRGPDGAVAELAFRVAAQEDGTPPVALYDRSDPRSAAPFPDDYWLEPDPAQPSGRHIALSLPPSRGLLGLAARGVSAAIASRDGFSPAQPFVLAFSRPVDVSALPRSEAASLDPAAAIGLFDMDPRSPAFGERVGFSAEARTDRAPSGAFEHTLLLYPAQLLRQGGHYVLVVTRQLTADGAPGQPFAPSDFFRAVAGAPQRGEPVEVARARESLAPALAFLAAAPQLPIPPEDVALALSVRVETKALDASDWVALKEQTLAAPPPELSVSTETTDGDDRVLRGTIELPLYIEAPEFGDVTRDERSGRPLARASDRVPFVLRIPQRARPVPIVIYQHGSPGSPEEINAPFNRFLLDAGYAMIGIQDFANRQFGADHASLALGVLSRVVAYGRVPRTQLQTHADLFGLLRAVEAMGAPDRFPEIDATQIDFRGVSFGANHALGFLPFAPEVTAAVAVAGGGRFFENALHQAAASDTLSGLQSLLPEASPTLLLVGLAALQNGADADDPQYLARHLYREPLLVAGQRGGRPPSLLWLEGIGDRVVSSTALRSAADELGLPQVRPVIEASARAQTLDAPVSDDIAPGVTAGHFQYLPSSTPSCVALGPLDGHLCPQLALEAEAQILHFFASAGAGAAEIVNPLPEEPAP